MRVRKVATCSICGQNLNDYRLLKIGGAFYCSYHYQKIQEKHISDMKLKQINKFREIVESTQDV